MTHLEVLQAISRLRDVACCRRLIAVGFVLDLEDLVIVVGQVGANDIMPIANHHHHFYRPTYGVEAAFRQDGQSGNCEPLGRIHCAKID